MNGKQDDDGCPDDGTEIVKLLDDSIEFTARLHYVAKGGHTELKDTSARAVGLVALVLKGHPEIAKLRIEVQNEGLSRDETQRRAELIRDAIARQGIDSARLVPVGMGAGGNRLTLVIAERKVPRPASPAAAPSSKPADATGGELP